MSQEEILNEQEDDLLLKRNLEIRKKLVDKIVGPEMLNVPQDKTEAALLNNLLEGMDRQILARKKIKADEKNTNTLANSTTGLMAELLKKVVPANVMSSVANPSVETPVIPDNLVELTLVPGETDIGIQVGDYNTFMAKHQ